MPVNKVVFGAVAIMDISDSTVTKETLGKGVTAYDKTGEKITGEMEAGVSLPTLTNEGAAADLLTGKQLIDGDGNVVEGSMPTATQATPSITVDSSGLITASAMQTAGYVAAGTKNATKQLTTQAEQIITPGTTAKTIASGRYLTGTQTIKGDANLVAENIKSGVSIFGVAGSLEAGSGGGWSKEVCGITISQSIKTPFLSARCSYSAYDASNNTFNVKSMTVTTPVLANGSSTISYVMKNTAIVLYYPDGGITDVTVSDGLNLKYKTDTLFQVEVLDSASEETIHIS